MGLLSNKRRARQPDTRGVRADPTLGDRARPRLGVAPSPADGLIGEGHPLVHCQRCGADHLASAVWTLSTHPTSQGVVTYFRCPAGHADFYTTGR